MAESTSRKPFWITLIAAVVTVVVVLGATVGPTIVGCFGSEEGFGQCARTRLADVGLLRQGASPVKAPEQPQSAKVEAPAAEAEAPTATKPEPETVAVEPESAPEPETIIAPSLALVRAEPDGSVVIAGSAEPGVEVEIFASGELIGSTKAESSGDWVVVPEVPLPTGGVEITVETPESGQVADQSVVVVVQEDLYSEPLVVASTPGKASEILQGLDRSGPLVIIKPDAPVVSAQPAEPEVPTEPETKTAVASEQKPQPTPEPESEPEPIVVAESTLPQQEEKVAATPAPVLPVATPEPKSEPTPQPLVVAAKPEVTAKTDPAPAEKTEPAKLVDTAPAPKDAPTVVKETVAKDAPTAPAKEPVVVEEEPIVVADVTPKVVPVEPPAPSKAVTLIMPSIDAIEIDGDQNFFAGSGSNGAVIRLYVDDQFIADTIVSDNRWLVQTDRNVLTKTTQRVRIDMLETGSANVAARAEVNFEISLPDDTPQANQPEPVAVAKAPPAVPAPEVETAEQPKPEAEPANVAQQAAVPTTPEPTVTERQETEKTAATTPVPATKTEPAVVVSPAPQTPAATPSQPKPVERTAQTTPVEQPTPPVTKAEEVPTLVAVQIGDPEDQRFASGKAIIRRGDNLWTIARRVYGHGLRYTTIYQANKGQIRDPDLIFPGQIFDLPEDSDG